MNLSKTIKNEARRLGFSLVGITSPEPPPHFSFYQYWLERGYHAEMSYLETERARDRRADPRLILPECKSILMLGIHYKPSEPQKKIDDLPCGRVAAYAWGEDYHITLKPRLEAIVNFIESRIGTPVANRWYTDTGPILERDLAQRAGLGWIGKNSCLINPETGSHFLIAEILLDLQLEFDEPFATDHCGTCTRCIDACPTACILPGRVIDSRKCISYLTIENKGRIPEQLRPQLEDWVFGCDICQQVCPWNIRFALPDGEPAFSIHEEMAFPVLEEELRLTPEDFNKKFKNHPIKRSKRRGYLRNVAVALGNSGAKGSIPILELAIKDHEALVREHAAWALGEIGGMQARKILEEAISIELTPEVLKEINHALMKL